MPVAPTLRREMHCRKCGYNLHTLPINARCPECATDICDTLELDRLFVATFMRRVAWSSGLMGCLNLVVSAIAADELLSTVVPGVPKIPPVGIWLIYVLYAGLLTFGAWLVTSRGERARSWRWPMKILIRLTSVASVLTAISLTSYASPCGLLSLSTPLLFYGLGRHFAFLCDDVGEPKLAQWHLWTSRLLVIGTLGIALALSFVGPSLDPRASDVLSFCWTSSIYGGMLFAAAGLIGETYALLLTSAAFRSSGGISEDQPIRGRYRRSRKDVAFFRNLFGR